MSKLNLHELNNLSKLLLSDDDSNIQLGLEIISNHPDAITILYRVLVVIWQMHDELEMRLAVEALLNKKYSSKKLDQIEAGFELFRLVPVSYKYSPKIQKLIKQHENIRMDYQQFIQQNKSYALKYYSVAKKLHQTFEKHLDLVECYYSIALKANPNHQDTLFYFAFLLDKHEDGLEEALSYYLKIESINNQSAAALNNAAVIYQKLKQYDAAYEYYKKALHINPNSTLYMNNLAGLCSSKMEGTAYKQEAKELLQRLIAIDPQSGKHWNTWADYLWNIEQDYPATLEAYQKGLEVAPKNPFLLGNLGELYIDIYKEYDKGIALYEQALIIKKTPYRLVTMITVLVLHYHEYSSAKEYYKELIALSPPQKIQRSNFLREDQWQAFLKAEALLKSKLKG